MTTAEARKIEIPAPNLGRIDVRIVGLSPYMRSPWTEREKRSLVSTEGSGQTEKLTPEEEYQQKLDAMLVEDGDNPVYGMPPVAFSEGMAAAGYRLGDWSSMVELKGALSIVNGEGEIPIESPGPEMDTRPGNLAGQGSVKLAVRPKFFPWAAEVPIEFDQGVLNRKGVIRLLQDMGRGVGIGAYRPENGGPMGTFEVESAHVYERMNGDEPEGADE